MVTGPTHDHARFDELAAGHALHALDTGDEREFLGHLPGCSRCQDALTDYLHVTAALAASWPEAEPARPGDQLRGRIMEAVSAPSAPGGAPPAFGGGPAGVAHLSGRRNRRRLRAVIASAAAAMVLAAGGVAGAELAASPGRGPAQPTAGCVHAGKCRQVVLTAAGSSATAARVIVMNGAVWLMPSRLPPDNAARQIYVLWQITGGHIPMAVGSFDIRGHADRPIRIGALAVPYRTTWAFAVSLEHGRTIPATPSHPVALGQAH